MTRYKITGWNLKESDSHHPCFRYDLEFPFETHSVNNVPYLVAIPHECYKNPIDINEPYKRAIECLNIDWLQYEVLVPND